MSTDRNQAARDKFAQAQQQRQAMQQFAQAVASGATGVIDRFGNRIEPGSSILFKPPFDYIYKVESISPVLEPGAPAGLVRMRLTIDVPVAVPVNQQQMNMIVVSSPKGGEQPQAPAAEPQAPATADALPVEDEPAAEAAPNGPRIVEP